MDSFTSFLSDSSKELKSNKNDKRNPIKKQTNIWKEQFPSIKDISISFLKQGIVVGIGLIYLFTFTLLTSNLLFSFGFMIAYFISFIIVFHKDTFHFGTHLVYETANPFKNYDFWQTSFDNSILFMTCSREQLTTGIKLFQIEILPENVKANLDRFISAMASQYVPFSYQVTQKPLLSSVKKKTDDLSQDRFQTIILFSLFYDVHGTLTATKLNTIMEKLNRYSISLKNNFLANFHHYKIVELKGARLASSLCSFILKKNIPNSLDNTNLNDEAIGQDSKVLNKFEFLKQGLSFPSLLKICFIAGVLITINSLFLFLHVILIWQIIISIFIAVTFIYYWIPQLYLFINKSNILAGSCEELYRINLFSEVHFFKAPGIKETIFYETKDGLVGGIKLLNLSFATPPVIALPYKFYQAVIQQGINFSYTFQALPTSYEQFTKQCSQFLTENEWKRMQNQLSSSAQQGNWLGKRRGIWRTIVTLSSSYNLLSSRISIEEIELIETKLHQNLIMLQNAFQSNFTNCHFSILRSKKLEMGILFEILKNNRFRNNGSHLSHLIFEGTSLSSLIWLSDLFKKGVETKIATEFNSPLHLENFIVIGRTINTETLTKEIPAGFTKTQLDNFLIINGKLNQQQLISMQIVCELVKKEYASLIFDFTGEWTSLIRHFQGSKFENNFLYYKIGKTFNLDLIHSEISKHDPNNIDYLDYMFEAYGLVFKKDDHTIEVFKNTLMNNLDQGTELSSSTVTLKIENLSEWQSKKDPAVNSVINFLHAFTREEMSLFHMRAPASQTQNIIQELLSNDKTVIIDLSMPNGLEKKVFLMFVLLAKCIHFIKNGKDFIPKFLILPHIDIAFDAFSLDKNMRYGRINKFFDPLRKAGYGLIGMASQIRYLHSSLFTEFENFLTFKATDTRDIALLKNVMALDTVHGTGIYSKTRNESYQVKYLMSMRFKEALVKRDDIYQPFPIETDWDLIQESRIMNWEEIVSYMRQQGYDLEFAERKLIAQTKKTIFEKDFGAFSNCIEPIITFLGDLRTMDQIGNLFAETIKEELKIRLDAKLSQLSQKKKKKKQMRDEIFQILLKHEYLKEHHPPQASGSESFRISYFVGPKFDTALEDYLQVKRQIPTEIEIIQQDFQSKDVSESISSIDCKTSIDSHKLKEVIAKQIGGTLFFDLFEIYRAMGHKDYRGGLEKAKDFLTHFIFQLYNEYYNVDYVITNKDLEEFIYEITNSKDFPFNYDDFKKYMHLCESISFTDDNLENKIQDIYNKLEMIHNRINNYIYSQ